jgi:hypothetical protein
MTSYFESIKQDGDKKKTTSLVRPDDVKEYKPLIKNKVQPLPGAEDCDVLEYIESICKESLRNMQPMHQVWNECASFYHVTPPDFLYASMNDPQQDDATQDRPSCPALIRRFTDQLASFMTRQLFTVEPLVQFTRISDDTELRRIQNSYVNYIHASFQKFGAKHKFKQAAVDLFLYGNMVLKADFHQERVMCEEPESVEVELNENVEDESKDPTNENFGKDISSEDFINIKVGKNVPKYLVTDQYAEFYPVFLGNFIIDPSPSRNDWKKAAYMGDWEHISTEELLDRYGEIDKVKKYVESGDFDKQDGRISPLVAPFAATSSSFITNFASRSFNTDADSRNCHRVLHIYTRKTYTCIIDDVCVAIHRYHDRKTSSTGPYPYILCNYNSCSNTLFSIGIGTILRHIQLEQIFYASERFKHAKTVSTPILGVTEGSVDMDSIQRITVGGNYEIPVIVIKGSVASAAIQQIKIGSDNPSIFLDSERLNVERARDDIGVPAVLDASNIKSHTSGIPQQIQAAQSNLDTLLDELRENLKFLFQKMHLMSLANLKGKIVVQPAPGKANVNKDIDSLDEEDLAKLATSENLTLQLTAGEPINDDKVKHLIEFFNTKVGDKAVSILDPASFATLLGMVMTAMGINDFDNIFSPEAVQDALAKAAKENEEAQAAQQIPGVPPQGEGMLPEGMPQPLPPGVPPQ